MKRNYELKWYVLNEPSFGQKIAMWNIFENTIVDKTVREALKKYSQKKLTKKELTKEIIDIIQWEEWSRCEYEILCTSWPPLGQFKEEEFKAGETFEPMFEVETDVFDEYHSDKKVIYTRPVNSNKWEEKLYSTYTYEGWKTEEIKFDKDTIVRYPCARYNKNFVKVDAYEQVLPNLEALVEYCIKQAGITD